LGAFTQRARPRERCQAQGVKVAVGHLAATGAVLAVAALAATA
jgi:hypothetical protein